MQDLRYISGVVLNIFHISRMRSKQEGGGNAAFVEINRWVFKKLLLFVQFLLAEPCSFINILLTQRRTCISVSLPPCYIRHPDPLGALVSPLFILEPGLWLPVCKDHLPGPCAQPSS